MQIGFWKDDIEHGYSKKKKKGAKIEEEGLYEDGMLQQSDDISYGKSELMAQKFDLQRYFKKMQ